MIPPHPAPRVGGSLPLGSLAFVAVLSAGVLVLNAETQIFDTNFYSLWEATSLLAGDHPYRDFYEWGVPLQAAISAAAQRLLGHRILSEFLVHWAFIVAGQLVAFLIGYRVCRSVGLALLMAVLGLAVLPDTPTFHYPKLFLYPLAVYLAWRYMDRPSLTHAAALGLLTAIAFLFRHDHGLYIGVGSVFAFVLARWTVTARPWRLALRDSVASTAAASALLVPWLLVVQRSEGVPEYVRARNDLYRLWSADSPYRSLLTMNPVRFVRGDPRPAPRPGTVSFQWKPPMTSARRVELEQQFGLRAVAGPDENERWRYAVGNLDAPRLSGLLPLVDESEGLDWARLETLNSWLPTLEPSRVWLAQVTLLVPLLLLGSAGLDGWRLWRRGVPMPPDTLQMAMAAAFLVIVDARIVREPSYAHLIAPVTAALGTRFFRRPGPADATRSMTPHRAGTALAWTRRAVAAALLLLTVIAAASCLRATRFFQPAALVALVPDTFERLRSSPPVDAFASARDVEEWTRDQDREAWLAGTVSNWSNLLVRYMRECTAAGDRVLVSGQTPFHISYLIERPVAGGHLFWHYGWRSDPAREAALLALLERQSVPFAFSTHDAVLTDLGAYPRIRAYVAAHYTALPGARDVLLVDTRRRPTGPFGPYGFPCFK